MTTADSQSPEPRASEVEPDDVEGHRMLSPEQAQQRSDAARMDRERRLLQGPGDDTDDVSG